MIRQEAYQKELDTLAVRLEEALKIENIKERELTRDIITKNLYIKYLEAQIEKWRAR